MKFYVCLQKTILLSIVTLLPISCVTTKQEGDLLRADIAELNNKMSEVSQQQKTSVERDQEKIRALEARLKYLEQRQKIMMENSANGGVKVEKMISEMQALQGELEEARHALGETKQSVLETNKTVENLMAKSSERLDAVSSSAEKNIDKGTGNSDSQPNNQADKSTVTADNSKYPKEKKALYDYGYAFYKAGKYHDAVDAMEFFIKKFSADTTLVDNAYYWKGDAYFQLAKAEKNKKFAQNFFKKALLAYQEVMRMNKSDKEDGALYKSGQIFEALGFKEAPVFYEELIRNHKKSPLVHKAKKRLKALKK